MINFVPNRMGLINPEHCNNAVLKIFSASITCFQSASSLEKNPLFLTTEFWSRVWAIKITLSWRWLVMFNVFFIEGMSTMFYLQHLCKARGYCSLHHCKGKKKAIICLSHPGDSGHRDWGPNQDLWMCFIPFEAQALCGSTAEPCRCVFLTGKAPALWSRLFCRAGGCLLPACECWDCASGRLGVVLQARQDALHSQISVCLIRCFNIFGVCLLVLKIFSFKLKNTLCSTVEVQVK